MRMMTTTHTSDIKPHFLLVFHHNTRSPDTIMFLVPAAPPSDLGVCIDQLLAPFAPPSESCIRVPLPADADARRRAQLFAGLNICRRRGSVRIGSRVRSFYDAVCILAGAAGILPDGFRAALAPAYTERMTLLTVADCAALCPSLVLVLVDLARGSPTQLTCAGLLSPMERAVRTHPLVLRLSGGILPFECVHVAAKREILSVIFLAGEAGFRTDKGYEIDIRDPVLVLMPHGRREIGARLMAILASPALETAPLQFECMPPLARVTTPPWVEPPIPLHSIIVDMLWQWWAPTTETEAAILIHRTPIGALACITDDDEPVACPAI